MPNHNQLTLIGHIGRDAETRQAGATVVTEWTMAYNDPYKPGGDPQWFRCAMWGDRGAKVSEFIRKGEAICVVGRVAMRSYEKDGETKTVLEINVNDVVLLGGKADGDPQPRRHAAPPQRRPAAPAPAYPDDNSDIPF